jgi:trimeric autotransporter adhesin
MVMAMASNQILRRNYCAAGAALLQLTVFLTVTGTADAAQVGVAAAVNSDAFGTPPGGDRSTKVLGDNVIYNERIETSGSGLVQVLLVDGSTFTVGANSNLVIDEFVYDPNSGSGKLVATFGKGVARFVGGKLSKKRGGVTVNTRVGTIGIRGGIANFNLTPASPVISLLFGKDLTFTSPDGKTARVYKAGYTMEIGPDGTAQVRKTTQGDLGAVQAGLTAGDQNGGIGKPPNDSRIAGSGVPEVNSRLGRIRVTPPIKPTPVQSTQLLEVDETLVQTQQLTQEKNTEDLRPQVEAASSETDNARVLRAGTSFPSVSAASGRHVGTQGIAAGYNEVVVFTQQSTSESSSYRLWSGTADGSEIYIFDPQSEVTEYYTQSVNSDGDIVENHSTSSIPIAPSVSGTIVQNARGLRITDEDFGFYTHFVATVAGSDPTFNYGGTDYFYALYGNPTDFSTYGTSSDAKQLKIYTLYGDALTAFQLASENNVGTLLPATSLALFLNPAIAEDLGTTFLSGVGSTGLQILEHSPDTLENAKYLAASFHISGSQSDQKSFVSLSLGLVENEDGTLILSGERQGGHRTLASQTAGLYGGPIESLEGGNGGTFFGDNANNLVLSVGDLENDSVFTDGYAQVPSGINYTNQLSGTMHAAKLTGETAVSSLDRQSTTLSGYGAGALEAYTNYNPVDAAYVGPVIFNSSQVGDFSLEFNSTHETITSSLKVYDVTGSDDDVSDYKIGFGDTSGSAGSGNSIYVDGDTFAATEGPTNSGTYLVTDRASTVQQKSGTSAQSFLIPNDLVSGADNDLFQASTKCTCAFMEWGYWGSKMEFDDSNLDQEERFDTFHLGTWVAGNVTNSSDLPFTGTASYTGHAVGNVINNGAQYLAAGDFNMSVSFADRAGTATISNFDSRSFSATVNETTVPSGNMFTGTISGITGTINTSLVSGPDSNHQGVVGNFNAVDGNWQATGIVAGEQN